MDGKNGLDMLKAKLLTCCRQPYLVVFVDLNMPIMNGFEMMRALKDIQKKEKKMLEYEKTTFILATCQYEKDLDHDFKELNFTEFLQKPLQANTIKGLFSRLRFDKYMP